MHNSSAKKTNQQILSDSKTIINANADSHAITVVMQVLLLVPILLKLLTLRVGLNSLDSRAL